MKFEWDEAKAKENLRDHGVSFEEARTIFDDPNWLENYDLGHSKTEDRFMRIGHSDAGRLLVVVYVKRSEVYRPITARRADRKERGYYFHVR